MGDTPAEEEERRPGGTWFDGIWNPLFAVKDACPPSTVTQGVTTPQWQSFAHNVYSVDFRFSIAVMGTRRFCYLQSNPTISQATLLDSVSP
jgi:hypothetical protein